MFTQISGHDILQTHTVTNAVGRRHDINLQGGRPPSGLVIFPAQYWQMEAWRGPGPVRPFNGACDTQSLFVGLGRRGHWAAALDKVGRAAATRG